MTLDKAALIFVTYAYPLLAAINLAYAFVRIYRYWQVQREKWLLWKAVANFGEALTLGLFSAYTSTQPYIDTLTVRPWARFCWLLVLIPLIIAMRGEIRDLRTIARKRTKELFGNDVNRFYRGV